MLHRYSFYPLQSTKEDRTSFGTLWPFWISLLVLCEQHNYMASFVHTSVLTGVAGLSTNLRLSLLLGKRNSPKSFKCEWDMTDRVWFVNPWLLKPYLPRDLHLSSMPFCGLTATDSQATESIAGFSTKALVWPSPSTLSLYRNSCQKGSIL